MTWMRRGFLRRLAGLTAPVPAPNTNTREVTAEQLANGIAAPGDGEAGSGEARPARRSRRPRRTPSQVSTKSLPAYNKEPGDEELVIFRCVLIQTSTASNSHFGRIVVPRRWKMAQQHWQMRLCRLSMNAIPMTRSQGTFRTTQSSRILPTTCHCSTITTAMTTITKMTMRMIYLCKT